MALGSSIEFSQTIAAGSIANSNLAPAPANSVKANATGSSAAPQDVTISAQSLLLRKATNLVETTCAPNKVLGRASSGDLDFQTCTDAGFALLDDVNTTAQRTTLGLGDSATKNVGSTAGTVCAGDDARLSDARTPTSHTHTMSNVTDAGNSATRNVGTTAGTVAAGDDSRIIHPYFVATMSANQNIGNAAFVKVAFDTIVFDSHGWYDVVNYRYTPLKAGKYVYWFSNRLTAVSPTVFQWSLHFNANIVAVATSHTNPPTYQAMNVCRILNHNGTTDFTEAFAWISASSGNTIEAGAWSYFQAMWIAP